MHFLRDTWGLVLWCPRRACTQPCPHLRGHVPSLRPRACPQVVKGHCTQLPLESSWNLHGSCGVSLCTHESFSTGIKIKTKALLLQCANTGHACSVMQVRAGAAEKQHFTWAAACLPAGRPPPNTRVPGQWFRGGSVLSLCRPCGAGFNGPIYAQKLPPGSCPWSRHCPLLTTTHL